jgi:hypothetical protein
MSVTVDELRQYVGAKADKDSILERNLDSAIELIDRYLGSKLNAVPEQVYESAVLLVAQELYYRDTRNSSSGGQYATSEGFITATPKRDPVHFAYPLLRPFVGWF